MIPVKSHLKKFAWLYHANDRLICWQPSTLTESLRVSALDFIEHLSKDEIFHLLHLACSSQPVGGRLLLRTPIAASPFGMSARYGDITHEVCFTSAALADVLRSNGYQVISSWEDGPTLGTVKQSLRWLACNIVRGIIGQASAAESGAWGDAIYTRNFWLLARKVEE